MYTNITRQAQTVVEQCRAILFPAIIGGGEPQFDPVAVSAMQSALSGAIRSCCSLTGSELNYLGIAARFAGQLAPLSEALSKDVLATYNGDPAAESLCEVVMCYPGIKAISSYRIAHCLYQEGVPVLPRVITELAHSETGIDINPAATIGSSFAIDHGTGVVIGATAILGNNIKLYQGVTLGAKSFPLDADGNPVKGIPRHPILEDNVIVYSNATILGRITIGHDAVIGGNIWVTGDVAPGTRVVQSKTKIS